MRSILPRLRHSVKEELCKRLQRIRDAHTRLRYLIIINLHNGRGAYETAKVLSIHNTTVYQVVKRFRQHGEWGLWDARVDNGQTKLEERYIALLHKVVRSSPHEHGWRRPTWTREMLVETMARKSGVRIHVATMSRALAMAQARRGRPRPTVRCPWPGAWKTRRLNALRKLLSSLPAREVAVYEDEVDIHLNPKIGWDWMVRGQQKQVVTPGQNVKRYLAGALEVRTGKVVWVEGDRKTSVLFIALLEQLIAAYPQATKIHVILDNFRIHSSALVQAAIRYYGGRVRFHFLPPYCPEENKIERVWEDLHANVTRNHRCSDIKTLMKEVHHYLKRRNLRHAAQICTQAA
jgi:transposase